MSNEVTNMLNALRDGKMSIDEVAERFRTRKWPQRTYRPRTSDVDIAIEALQDPEPYLPGSYDDVAAAQHHGDITLAQYGILVNAIGQSIAAEKAQMNEDGPSAQE